ncbi:serine/threonine-protein phosphatase 7 long form-like protein [Cucumis melo var. makuwa]|uniref:Serine/threonine-protein phosphatase 7 long form-like protein n=1 Tax=Cucumis melo var. makuwa TaxID=1194695 RepID=A0A5D3DKK6_CUCMM|nr:serine/threonine-protein phosphatase 7 long form-like protein [Cucumis melo var. makuwa]TYK24042.1 serine/threonine-protein phosphatase 7 long form-like protein [Cucumis melo var. makuwa]
MVYKDYLGVLLPDMKGQRLSLSWLTKQFVELSPDADVVSVQRYVHVYILQLIGGFMFANKSNTLVLCMFLPLLINFDYASTYV